MWQKVPRRPETEKIQLVLGGGCSAPPTNEYSQPPIAARFCICMQICYRLIFFFFYPFCFFPFFFLFGLPWREAPVFFSECRSMVCVLPLLVFLFFKRCHPSACWFLRPLLIKSKKSLKRSPSPIRAGIRASSSLSPSFMHFLHKPKLANLLFVSPPIHLALCRLPQHHPSVCLTPPRVCALIAVPGRHCFVIRLPS